MTEQQLAAMQQALEALEFSNVNHWWGSSSIEKSITSLRQALEQQPADEPVAYIRVSKTGHVMACAKSGDFYALPDKTLLYTRPQPAAWVGLTDAEIDECYSREPRFAMRRAEAKLREKNGGAA